MKKTISSGIAVRALSIFVVPVCFLFELHFSATSDWVQALACAFMCANYLILLYPHSSGLRSRSLFFAAAVFLSASLAPLSRIAGLSVYLSAGWGFVYLAMCYVRKYSDLKPLFKNDAPLLNLEDFSGAAHYSFVSFSALILAAGGVWPSLVMSALIFVVLFRSATLGRLPALSRERDNSVKEIIKGNLRSSPYTAKDPDSRMNALYARAVEYMEDRKPFLEDGFSLGSMSTALYTNKTYLSRVINYYSGRNFKQFVNYYRIRYAVELINKDPRLSVMELASMSGFHSTVTFNVAFRQNMNDTPGSFCRNACV